MKVQGPNPREFTRVCALELYYSGAPHIPPGHRSFGSWLLAFGSLVLVGWLLVGCRLLVGCLLVGCRLLVGWWLVVGVWLVGWLVVGGCFGWFVARSLWLVVGFGLQSCSELLGTTPSNLKRRWLGAGGGMLWLGRWVVGSVVGRLGRKPRFSLSFSRFLEGQANRGHTPRLFRTPRFWCCVF